MTHRTHARRLTLAVAAGALALGASAGSAHAATFSLNLSAPSNGAVGTPMLIQATGQGAPPEEYWNMAWMEVVAIPAGLMPTCPTGVQDGAGVAENGGGRILAISMHLNIDSVGKFTNQVGFTPWAPGPVRICGYLDNGVGGTLATAALLVDVRGAGGGAAKPANVKRPSLKRSGGTLVCTPGRWAGTPTGYSYRWLVDGKRKRGASGRKLGITSALRGHTVKCGVKASNSAGAGSALSRALRVG
jgi:hypothetical protein